MKNIVNSLNYSSENSPESNKIDKNELNYYKVKILKNNIDYQKIKTFKFFYI